MQLMLPRLLEQVSDVSNYMFVWLIIIGRNVHC